VFVLAVAALGLVVSCSSDDGDSSSTTAPGVTLSEATDGGAIDGDPTETTATPVEPGTAEEYAAALLASLTDDPDNRRLMNAEEAACIAPKWVETITPARLGAAGLAPADLEAQRSMAAIIRVGLSVEEAEGLVDEMGECGVDVRTRWVESIAPTEGTATPEARTCLETNLSADLIDRMAAVGLSGDDDDPQAGEASAEFLRVLQQCNYYPGGN
jgi:hypothetical protein